MVSGLCIFMSALLAILIASQLWELFRPRLVEGAVGSQNTTAPADGDKYQDPGLSKDPLYLAKVNASNITFLKSRIDSLAGLRNDFLDLKHAVDNNSAQIASLTEGMKQQTKDFQPSDKSQQEMAANQPQTADIPPPSDDDENN